MSGLTYSTPVEPRQCRLELTNRCNARCAPCHRNSMRRPIGDMSRELLEKCLTDLQAFPQPLIECVPSNYGEAGLAPDWADKLQLIARKLPRTQMVFPTNGTWLTDGAVTDLCRVPTLRLVNISANGFLPETYEAFHGLPARHMETLKRAADRIRQLRPDVTIWISMARDSCLQSPREVELFQEFWSRYGIVQINQAEYAGVPGKEPIIPRQLPCRSIFSDMAVNWDGRVTTCCYDADCHLVVGNAKVESLMDIWHSQEFNRIRNLHNAGRRAEIPLCKGCTFA